MTLGGHVTKIFKIFRRTGVSKPPAIPHSAFYTKSRNRVTTGTRVFDYDSDYDNDSDREGAAHILEPVKNCILKTAIRNLQSEIRNFIDPLAANP